MATSQLLVQRNPGNVTIVYGNPGDTADVIYGPPVNQTVTPGEQVGYLRYTEAGMERSAHPNVFTVVLRSGMPSSAAEIPLPLGTVSVSPFPYTYTGFDAPEQQTMVGMAKISFTFHPEVPSVDVVTSSARSAIVTAKTYPLLVVTRERRRRYYLTYTDPEEDDQ